MTRTESLSRFRDRICAEHHLESLWLDRHRGVLIIDLIAVDPAYRGEGHGGRAMAEICDYADQHGIRLGLTPADHYGSDLDRLTGWYRGLGFTGADYLWPRPYRALMIREPFAVPQTDQEQPLERT